MTTMLLISDITADESCQLRADGYNLDVIRDYAEAMCAGHTFPPITVFHDGATYWLADGFHRYAAAAAAGLSSIATEIREGGLLDAKIHAAGANATHGLQRTNRDKRYLVERLLDEPALAGKGSREIADICGVSHAFVSKVRRERSGNGFHPETGDLDVLADEIRPHIVQLRQNIREAVVELDRIRGLLTRRQYIEWLEREFHLNERMEAHIRRVAADEGCPDDEVLDACILLSGRIIEELKEPASR